jgi:hypothetical protein
MLADPPQVAFRAKNLVQPGVIGFGCIGIVYLELLKADEAKCGKILLAKVLQKFLFQL